MDTQNSASKGVTGKNVLQPCHPIYMTVSAEKSLSMQRRPMQRHFKTKSQTVDLIIQQKLKKQAMKTNRD